MGKRSDFEKKPNDYYPTPLAAVKPLSPFLPLTFTFVEPCAGDGRLVEHIKSIRRNSTCSYACDIEPQVDWVEVGDALNMSLTYSPDFIITNPPWSRDKKSDYVLHRMIETFSRIAPTWLLFDADWAQTKQATPYLDLLVCTVSVGRVKWIEDSKTSGKDNCQWYFFSKDANKRRGMVPLFFGRDKEPFSTQNMFEGKFVQ